MTKAIDISCIKKIDTQIEGLEQSLTSLIIGRSIRIATTIATDLPAAKADLRDFYARSSKVSIFHLCIQKLQFCVSGYSLFVNVRAHGALSVLQLPLDYQIKPETEIRSWIYLTLPLLVAVRQASSSLLCRSSRPEGESHRRSARIGRTPTALYPEKYVYDVAGHPKILAKDLAKNLATQAGLFKPTITLGEKVTNLTRQEDGHWQITTDQSDNHHTKSVLLALGAGACVPKKLDIEYDKALENESIFYAVKNKERFRGKNVLIVGGGDSAVDWANEFSDKASQRSP